MWILLAELMLAALIAGAVFIRGVWPLEAAAGALTQLALLAIFLAVLSLMLSRPLGAILLMGAAALGLWRAQEIFAPPSPPVMADIKIVWANIFDRPRSLAAAQSLALREKADMLAIAEYPAADNLSAEFRAAFPYRFPPERRETQDTVMFSRAPFAFTQELGLARERHPPILVKVQIGTGSLTVIAVHPPVPFTPGRLSRQRAQIARAFAAAPNGESAVIIGAFNAVPWNIALTDQTAASDAPKLLSLGPSATWLSPLPLLGARIDHAFISNDLQGSVRLGPANGSDHLPIVVSITR